MNKILVLLAVVMPGLTFASMQDDMPMNPEPGKCYARVVVPAKYKSINEKMMVKQESVSIKTIPAKYNFVTERVLVKEASEVSYVVPATYKTVKEKMLIEDEKRLLQTIPAAYKTVNKKIMVKPEGYEWKKGKGALQKVDHATGEILCYTKTPAVYKTVQERVIVREASVQEKIIPAKFGYVTKKVIDRPEQVKTRAIPAVYKNVKVKKMVEDAQEMKVTNPAIFKNVVKKELVSDSSTEWAPILCQTNASRSSISKVQKALAKKGFFKGSADGVIGSKTMAAVKRYQMKKGLATGGLTVETLKSLNINL